MAARKRARSATNMRRTASESARSRRPRRFRTAMGEYRGTTPDLNQKWVREGVESGMMLVGDREIRQDAAYRRNRSAAERTRAAERSATERREAAARRESATRRSQASAAKKKKASTTRRAPVKKASTTRRGVR